MFCSNIKSQENINVYSGVDIANLVFQTDEVMLYGTKKVKKNQSFSRLKIGIERDGITRPKLSFIWGLEYNQGLAISNTYEGYIVENNQASVYSGELRSYVVKEKISDLKTTLGANYAIYGDLEDSDFSAGATANLDITRGWLSIRSVEEFNYENSILASKWHNGEKIKDASYGWFVSAGVFAQYLLDDSKFLFTRIKYRVGLYEGDIVDFDYTGGFDVSIGLKLIMF